MVETNFAISHGSRWPDRASQLIFRRLAARVRAGSIQIRLPGGTELVLRGRTAGPLAAVTMNNWRALRRLVDGGTGLAEGYMAGDWNTSDLSTLLLFLAINLPSKQDGAVALPWRRLRRLLENAVFTKTRERARRQIAHHYDLGNEFYRAWLDRSLTYSSAIFQFPDQDLELAQANKYRRIADLAGLSRSDRVLEIGCGWGGFAAWAAREIGCHVTAITISDAQFDHASKHVSQLGLRGRVEIVRRDYRDVEGQYDKIVSIEMFEAVGEKHWLPFFEKVRCSLAPGGRAALQIITIDHSVLERYRRSVDFIQKYIFPGGFLPSTTALKSLANATGLQWQGLGFFGSHYVQTLGLWRQRFEVNWPEIEALGFGERFRRMWMFYLAYCEAGFRSGRIDLAQVALVRP